MKVREMKIKEFSTVHSGTTPKTSNPEFWSGDIKWITPAEMNDGHNWYINDSERKVTEKAVIKSNLKMLKPGTVLLTSRAPIGKVGLVGVPLCTNQGFKNIECDTSIMNPEFLYFWLISKKEYLNSLGRGATFKEISKKIVEEISVPVPPLQIQNKIVTILKQSLELIEKRNSQVIELANLTQSVFLEMFGDPVENPNNFRFEKLPNILEIPFQNGLYVEKHRYTDNGYKMLHMSDIFYEMANVSLAKQVDLSFKEVSKYKVDHNDILIARRSLNYEGAAKPCLIPTTEEPIVFESSLIKLRPNKDTILPIFLYYYLSNEKVRKNKVYKHITRSTISGINQKGLSDIDILIPPITLQTEFMKVVLKINEQKELFEKSLAHLELNHQALLQKAFKGEI